MNFTLFDKRNGKRATNLAYQTKEQAEREIEYFQRAFEEGRRPDLADILPHIGVCRLTWMTRGTRVGMRIAKPVESP